MTTEKSASKKKSDAQCLVESVAHPTRLEVLRVFSYRVASPNEVAQELGQGLSKITYHVKVLRDLGCIEFVKQQQVRGAVEHFYKAPQPAFFDDGTWAKLSRAEREASSIVMLRGIIGEVMRAIHRKTLDARLDRHVSWVPMELDAKGVSDLLTRQLELLEYSLQVKDESAERLLASGESGVRFVSAILGFETPPGFGFLAPES